MRWMHFHMLARRWRARVYTKDCDGRGVLTITLVEGASNKWRFSLLSIETHSVLCEQKYVDTVICFLGYFRLHRVVNQSGGRKAEGKDTSPFQFCSARAALDNRKGCYCDASITAPKCWAHRTETEVCKSPRFKVPLEATSVQALSVRSFSGVPQLRSSTQAFKRKCDRMCLTI